MKNTPVISIIVPVYNAEQTLHRCIESILAQSYTDFELLLIDDGSKDSSGTVCDKYAAKDGRVRVFHKKNGGVSSARNLGLDHAQGEWVTFVDSDDWVDSNYLICFITKSDGVDIVVSGLRFFSKNGLIELGVDYDGTITNVIIRLNNGKVLGYVCNKLFKKSIISVNKLRFDENIVFKEDEDFVLKYMTMIHSAACIKIASYNYACPDLSSKYLWVDNFWTNLSLFISIKRLIPSMTPLYQFYEKSAVNAFFSSFPTSVNCFNERLKRLKSISDVMKDEFHRINQLSCISRFFMQHPSIVSISFFQIKAYLWEVKRSLTNGKAPM